MANQKQSDVAFLMMKQWGAQLALLSIEQRGILLTAIYDYQCGGKNFETDDPMLQMMWATVKQGFEYNDKKYAQRCRVNKINAAKRWNPHDANACNRMRTDAFDADIDKDKDIDIDIETDNDIEIETEKETEEENEDTAAHLRILKRKFDEVVSSPMYQSREMRLPDSACPSLTVGEMVALHEFVKEEALERYFIKAGEYDATDTPKMILRWAAQDGTLTDA